MKPSFVPASQVLSCTERDDTYIRRIIRPKIESCKACLCLIGENTYRSHKWVPWEINLAAEEGKEIIAMRFKNMSSVTTPSVLIQHDIIPFDWDIDKLFKKLRK